MSESVFQVPTWKCPVHGGFGNLNRCPWPKCKHGVEANSLQVPRLLGGETIETFHRVKWIGLDGDEYYDWQTEALPNWFKIGRPYSYFANKIKESVRLDQMFHYTSADGALAILQSGRMRFTDYSYLNDTREITHGLDVVRSVLEDEISVSDSPALTDLKSHLDDVDPFSPYNIYTTSFSSDPDSLSQFRLYGPVALGFEANPNGFGFFKGEIHFDRIVYDPEKQAQLIRTFLNILKQSEDKDAALIESNASKKVTTDYLTSHLLNITSFFKHRAFSDEREVRLVYSEPQKIMEKFGQLTARRQFRATGGLIVPFTDTFDMYQPSFSDKEEQLPPKLPLKSVIIGPVTQAEALANGMRNLLIAEGYHDAVVSLSEAPFRT
ncbi:DUF2971 domain-containing protein [Thioclava sp. DLFJ5-1]|uniref:DUF2971 domain-containing protein n=1 Tax=Thioclava sp. DLFJ5-1 TaxID=1915314 RepID=UPI00099712A9|nr:DUF2971 domain-containing protein [Thioclava sp. DLFJ5-1]